MKASSSLLKNAIQTGQEMEVVEQFVLKVPDATAHKFHDTNDANNTSNINASDTNDANECADSAEVGKYFNYNSELQKVSEPGNLVPRKF